MKKRCQSGIEYLIIVGFVTFAIIGVLSLSYFYLGASKDKIRMNQIEVFANKIISTSEAVFYSGEPSQKTITVFIPENVKEVTISNKELIITAETSTGNIKRVFESKVNLNGEIQGKGTKKLSIIAQENYVEIS
jgi:hypothetical protein